MLRRYIIICRNINIFIIFNKIISIQYKVSPIASYYAIKVYCMAYLAQAKQKLEIWKKYKKTIKIPQKIVEPFKVHEVTKICVYI